MNRSNPSIALYLLLIFSSGVIVGAFGMRLYSPATAKSAAPEDWRKQYFNEMQSRLKLTAEQATQLNGILDETKTRAHQAHEAHDSRLREIREEQSAKVRNILTDEQRPEYDKIRAEREARAKLVKRN